MKGMVAASLAIACWLSLGTGAVAQARTPTKAEADAACEVGTDTTNEKFGEWKNDFHPTAGGLTPLTMPGAKRISADEIYCLMEQYPKVFLITPINDPEIIEGSYRIKDGWKPGTYSDAIQSAVVARLEEITGGRKNAPLISYCHNAACFMSWNLILRARAAGYTNVYWYRDGKQNWDAIQKFAKAWAAGAARAERDMALNDRYRVAMRCRPWAKMRIDEGRNAPYWQTFHTRSRAAALADGLSDKQIVAMNNDGVDIIQREIDESRRMDADAGIARSSSASLTRATFEQFDKMCGKEADRYQ